MTKARDIADNAGQGGGGNKNLVINGAMQVSQRHGTSSVQLSATEQYLVDRFFNDTGSNFNISADAVQSSDAPSGFANSLKLSCDAVTTPTSVQNGCITTLIEGQDCQRLAFGTSDAKDVTLSFYAKSSSQNSGHTYGIMLGAYLNGTRNAQVKSFTVTDSWQRFTITFNGTGTVTSTAINNDNANGMQISFSLAAGSSDQVSYSTWTNDTGLKGFTGQDNFFDNTNNEFYLTGVQLEVGDKATDFEHMSFADELQKCLRYFTKTYDMDVFVGHSGDDYDGSMAQRSISSTSSNQLGEPFSVRMRAMPTVTFYGPTPATNTAGTIRGSGNAAITANLGGNSNERTVYVQFTSNQSYSYISAHYTADAEL